MESAKGLKVIHLSIRSIISKIDLLRVWIIQNTPDVITISESWLDSKTSDNEVNIDDYTLFRADRGSRGGGLVTYVSNKLTAIRVYPTTEPINFECLCIEIMFHVNKRLTICNIYRPPSAPVDMNNILSTINSLKCIEIICLGDFNINWLHRSSSSIRNLVSNAQLAQIISEPTRVDERSSTLLDWILVSHPDRITFSGVLADSFSDHSVVFCVWKIKLPKLPPKFIKLRQTKHMNIDEFIK